MELRWQWTLANGGRVTAEIDPDQGGERVMQGSRVLSSSERGEKPEGHTILVASERAAGASERPPIEAIVTFAPTANVCILRVDDHEIAPSIWPLRAPKPLPPPTPRSSGNIALVVLGLAALVAVGFFVRSLRREAPPPPSLLAGAHRASNGSLIAHFPEDLEPRPSLLPGGVSGITLEDKAKTVTIVLAAASLETLSRDPWVLQQRLFPEALANLPKGEATYEETTRRDDTCVGQPGAVVAGRIMQNGDRKARVWSCAFSHDKFGYIAVTMSSEATAPVDEKRLRKIIEATELTRLADLGAPPMPSL